MLPQIAQPTFDVTIPSTGKSFKFRRFLVGEEKILLMGKQSEDRTAIAGSVIDVATICSVGDLDIGNLKPFDLDYLFLKLRSQSVDNIVRVKYTDVDDEEYELEINLDTVKTPVVDKMTQVVKVDDNISVEVQYPSVSQMLEITKAVNGKVNPDISLTDYVIAASIARVFDANGEEFTADSPEEIFEFIDQFPSKSYNKIKKFLDDMPELSHTIKFTDKAEVEREVVLSGINDFFTF